MKYKFIKIVTVLVMINIVFIPFICNRFWEFGETYAHNTLSFLHTIRDLSDSFIDYSVPIHLFYYLGELACAIFILIRALAERPAACICGSLVGIGLSSFILYQVNFSDTIWYVGGNNAQLTFGFYISYAGFISMLIASLVEEKE